MAKSHKQLCHSERSVGISRKGNDSILVIFLPLAKVILPYGQLYFATQSYISRYARRYIPTPSELYCPMGSCGALPRDSHAPLGMTIGSDIATQSYISRYARSYIPTPSELYCPMGSCGTFPGDSHATLGMTIGSDIATQLYSDFVGVIFCFAK